jgi:hypothetical protein
MKRLICIFLSACLLCCTLVGCGGEKSSSGSNASSNANSDPYKLSQLIGDHKKTSSQLSSDDRQNTIPNVPDLIDKLNTVFNEIGIDDEGDTTKAPKFSVELMSSSPSKIYGYYFNLYLKKKSLRVAANDVDGTWQVLAVQNLDSKKFYWVSSEILKKYDIYDYKTDELKSSASSSVSSKKAISEISNEKIRDFLVSYSLIGGKLFLQKEDSGVLNLELDADSSKYADKDSIASEFVNLLSHLCLRYATSPYKSISISLWADGGITSSFTVVYDSSTNSFSSQEPYCYDESYTQAMKKAYKDNAYFQQIDLENQASRLKSKFK